MHNRSFAIRARNERSGLTFRVENCGNGITTTFPNYYDNPALAALVPRKAAINTMCFVISRFDVPTKYPPSTSASLPSPPTTRPFNSSAMASPKLVLEEKCA